MFNYVMLMLESTVTGEAWAYGGLRGCGGCAARMLRTTVLACGVTGESVASLAVGVTAIP